MPSFLTISFAIFLDNIFCCHFFKSVRAARKKAEPKRQKLKHSPVLMLSINDF